MQKKSLFLIIPVILGSAGLRAQADPELLGLEGKEITSMELWSGMIFVGTNGDGVFYQYTEDLPDSGWINMGLEGKHVTAVYPHKSGPLGWGLTAGVSPSEEDSIYVYCSFMGGEFFPNSAGIQDSLAEEVFSLAGFPDPSICGEKYAATGGALYRQLWGDSLWVPVYEKKGIEGEGVIHVETREDVGGVVLAGGSEGVTGVLLIASSDYGDTWEHLYPPGPAMAFDFDVNLDGELQTIFVSYGNEISRSLDGGDSWEIVFGEETYTGVQILDIRYDPLTQELLAGGINIPQIESQALLASSSDLGETWNILLLQDMDPIVSVGLGPDGHGYFAMPGSGVFRVPLGALSIESNYVLRSFVLHPPYPNPFNPSTTIEFSIARSSAVTLTVYDLLGRELETILNEPVDAGRHQVEWNPSNIPSGIYFVTMQARGSAETRKVMVLR